MSSTPSRSHFRRAARDGADALARYVAALTDCPAATDPDHTLVALMAWQRALEGAADGTGIIDPLQWAGVTLVRNLTAWDELTLLTAIGAADELPVGSEVRRAYMGALYDSPAIDLTAVREAVRAAFTPSRAHSVRATSAQRVHLLVVLAKRPGLRWHDDEAQLLAAWRAEEAGGAALGSRIAAVLAAIPSLPDETRVSWCTTLVTQTQQIADAAAPHALSAAVRLAAYAPPALFPQLFAMIGAAHTRSGARVLALATPEQLATLPPTAAAPYLSDSVPEDLRHRVIRALGFMTAANPAVHAAAIPQEEERRYPAGPRP